MRKANLYKSADLRRAMRLLGECRELGDGPMVWRHHFCAGLGKMVGAAIVMNVEVDGCLRGPTRMRGDAAWQIPDATGEHRLGVRFAQVLPPTEVDNRLQAECWRALFADVQGNPRRGATVSHPIDTLPTSAPRHGARKGITANCASHRSADGRKILQSFDTDAVMHSLCPVNPLVDEFDGVTLCRAVGEPMFDEREVALVQLVHHEVARLVGGPLARFDEPAPSQLPPRVRQVLRCLLEGDGDKQIATRLTLSQHTVNQYTKQIYRYFTVQSRTELLARWLRRGWGPKTDWELPTTASLLLEADFSSSIGITSAQAADRLVFDDVD